MTITTVEAHIVILVTTVSSLIGAALNFRQLRNLREKLNGHLNQHMQLEDGNRLRDQTAGRFPLLYLGIGVGIGLFVKRGLREYLLRKPD